MVHSDHIDADMSIHRLDLEYPSHKSFTYCIDSGNTHCRVIILFELMIGLKDV